MSPQSTGELPKIKASIQKKPVNPAKVLIPLGLGTALSLMGDATLYTVLPTHTADAGITLAAVGIILSANRIIRLILNGPSGAIYDRSPRRRLFIPALFLGAISTAIYAAWSGFWPLITGRLIWGLAWAGIWVGGATIIMDVTTDENRGRWTGLYQTWFFLGVAAGAFLGGLLTDWLGYSPALWIGAALTLIGAVIALIFLPETRSADHRIPTDITDKNPIKWYSNQELLGVVSLQGINRFITAGVIAATLALLVQENLSIINIALGVATVTGILIGFRTLLSMIAAPIAGSMSDKSGNRWGITFMGLIIGALGMLLLVTGNVWIILLGVCFTAVAGGTVQALVTTRTGDMVNKAQRGKAIGFLHTAGDLGSALGPLAAYALLRWVQLSGVYILCAIIFVIGAIYALRMHIQHRNPQKQVT
jgi:MFS family permease